MLFGLQQNFNPKNLCVSSVSCAISCKSISQKIFIAKEQLSVHFILFLMEFMQDYNWDILFIDCQY